MEKLKKTRGILTSEIFRVMRGRDYAVLLQTISENFPKVQKAIDKLDKLSIVDLEELIPLLETAYAKKESGSGEQLSLEL